MNNNVIIAIPFYSKAGAFPLSYNMLGNSFVFQNSSHTWVPSLAIGITGGSPFLESVNGGFLGVGSGTPPYAKYGYSIHELCPDGVTYTWYYSQWYVLTADGTFHFLPASDATDTAGCYKTGFTDQTTDNSHLTLATNLGVVAGIYTTAGMVLASSSLTDPNGNAISVTGAYPTLTITDTLGLPISRTSAYWGVLSWTDVNGGSPSVTPLYTTTMTLQTNFGCSGTTDFGPATNESMVTGVSFPDSTSIGITYEGTPSHSGNYTGRVNKLTLREGGTVSFSYGGGSNNGIDCTYQTVPVLTRKLGNGDKTTYTLSHSLISGTSNYKATNTVVDPGGNQTIYTFTGFTSSGNSATYAQVLTQIQRYQGNGSGATLLTTDIYCYNIAFSSCSTTAAPTSVVTLPIKKQIVFHNINGMSKYSAVETDFDSNGYGNVIYSAEYDFGGSTP